MAMVMVGYVVVVIFCFKAYAAIFRRGDACSVLRVFHKQQIICIDFVPSEHTHCLMKILLILQGLTQVSKVSNKKPAKFFKTQVFSKKSANLRLIQKNIKRKYPINYFNKISATI
jgi:hypothetical protein